LASLEKLMKLGLVHRDSTLGLFIVEHPANIIDSIKKGTLNVEAHSRGHTTVRGRVVTNAKSAQTRHDAAMPARVKKLKKRQNKTKASSSAF
jgi:hypothetical protein